MKSITVISGKGGTGKTTLTASFAAIAKSKVLADCDVDAADLHLLLQPEVKREEVFEGGKLAQIDSEKCVECGKCVEACRFGAISDEFIVSPIDCEGCNVCAYVCPVDAITLNVRESGKWSISETRFGPMVHAGLAPGQGNSGMLVSLVREQAESIAVEQDLDCVIIDGPPGMGCPVIGAITGTDVVLVVTEPTLSAMHDMERIVGLTTHFQVPAAVCINKYDLNLRNTREIESFLHELETEFSNIPPQNPPDRLFRDSMIGQISKSTTELIRLADKSVNVFDTAFKLNGDWIASVLDDYPGLGAYPLRAFSFLPDFGSSDFSVVKH